MDPTLAAVLGGVIGAALALLSLGAMMLSERAQRKIPESPEPAVPSGVATVLSVLRSSAVVMGPEDQVLQASAPAHVLGIVRGERLVVDDILTMVRQVRRDGEIRQQDLEIVRGRLGATQYVSARVAPLGSQLVLVLVEDRTRERRLDAIRRDFTVNVSHELKTPVGALILLADAVSEASDDPEAVQRFSDRMRIEASRLSRLVKEIIELSRLQGDDPLENPGPVDINGVIETAVDRCRIDAEDRDIKIVVKTEPELEVLGSEDQLAMAIGNLVENAINYSPDGTRVAVAAHPIGDLVEVTVSDQGVGIPSSDLERVFERFYRVDRARSRETGGTGLGLSIVKHIASIHGGDVRVWSVEGQGSTFTVRLPLRLEPAPGQTDSTSQEEPAVPLTPTPSGQKTKETAS
ncbi:MULTISPECIES: cell wall metabolism sensor histidine kinase WalK [Kribbella]|uniref:Sensor-like histidine kinase SenX3 n=1 Tax=Kribbella pratensis TaxID=2512112 RepID=A0ABY2FI15_9ACTN|nr:MULTISPECIES: ATP-binding protein [Kribbella]TDW90713.1 two-component system sensor histidine kinase SenX3 [Kribbella pratensis]TDW98445.1 two-component system sensor histidine kinase SenX3 [Kribbella sp. VKM Ac-2566]